MNHIETTLVNENIKNSLNSHSIYKAKIHRNIDIFLAIYCLILLYPVSKIIVILKTIKFFSIKADNDGQIRVKINEFGKTEEFDFENFIAVSRYCIIESLHKMHPFFATPDEFARIFMLLENTLNTSFIIFFIISPIAIFYYILLFLVVIVLGIAVKILKFLKGLF